MCVWLPSSISDLKPVKTASSSTLYVITPSLLKTFHLLCKNSQVAYVCHHMRYTWHPIHTLWKQPLLFMTSHALYSIHPMHYIWHLIYFMWCHIHYVCYITHWLYLWHQTFYVYDIFIYMASCTVLWPNNHCVPSQHYAWHYTQCILDITHNVQILWKKVNVCHHSMYLYDTIRTTYDITSTL